MKPLLPGQAALARLDGKIVLVACDLSELLPLGAADFAIRGGMHQINIANVLVPAVSIVLRLTVGDAVRFYWCWVNELEEGLIESLATQADLPILVSVRPTTGRPNTVADRLFDED
ncbi:MAG: hypothetical protein IAF94_18655 [Pirellulaceae bacterium]|nr:hypothetical protein [Pirellulaceae bacterium]